MDYDKEEAFARKYSRLVSRLVRPFFLKGGDYDDLYQEGMIGLLKAIRLYDSARSDNFEAYATLCVKSRLYDALRSDISLGQRERQAADRLWALAASAKEHMDNDPETLWLANESAKEIETELHGLLSAFEASVLEPYLKGFSVNEIAQQLERSPKSVDNAIGRIRRKLSHYLRNSRK